MTDQPSTAPNRMQARTDGQKRALQKREVLAAIGGKWGKFSEQELSDLKNEDDLAVQVAAKYGIEKAIAQRDVADLLNGRAL
ncbi:MAG: hypothetical protein J0J01_06495 [Reyranella sp.]|uniref:hypothetical protein n=1 Tax=Reyranella sp. TaxID=1929291 RepID=UPI001AD4C967|nr:hypothetical protein [Reyranella sp.]MBN9086539.1 hypothetical protein [Reyranella sp.]